MTLNKDVKATLGYFAIFAGITYGSLAIAVMMGYWPVLSVGYIVSSGAALWGLDLVCIGIIATTAYLAAIDNK